MAQVEESVGVSEERTPLTTILTYAAPAPCVGFMFFLVSLYLMKFSTDVLLIAPGVMGVIFGVSRIWDGISDHVDVVRGSTVIIFRQGSAVYLPLVLRGGLP